MISCFDEKKEDNIYIYIYFVLQCQNETTDRQEEIRLLTPSVLLF